MWYCVGAFGVLFFLTVLAWLMSEFYANKKHLETYESISDIAYDNISLGNDNTYEIELEKVKNIFGDIINDKVENLNGSIDVDKIIILKELSKDIFNNLS